MQKAARLLREYMPREGWVKAIRTSLGMSTRAFARTINAKDHGSVRKLERNEISGAVTLDALRRAARALDADFVYAIIPRRKLRETVAARAHEIARRRIAPIAKSMALEEQGLNKEEIDRHVEELARELEQKPEALWR